MSCHGVAESHNSENYIDYLPVEILRMIFDRLDIKSVKNASLTCHRWNNIIFHSGYVSRFVCHIYSSYVFWEEENKTTLRVNAFREVVANSQRSFRHLHWQTAGNIEITKTCLLWDTIHPKLTNNLISLKLSKLDLEQMLPVMSDAIQSMTQLRSLVLIDQRRHLNKEVIIPPLRSKTVQRLQVYSQLKIRVDMPELQSYVGHLNALYPPDESSEPVALVNLKNVIVTGKDIFGYNKTVSMDTAQHVIPRLNNLEKMVWKMTTGIEVFDLICETCTTLKTFIYDGLIHADNKPSFRKLTKLVNLRVLAMPNISVRDDYRLDDEERYWWLDFSKFTQLQALRLSHFIFPSAAPHTLTCLDVEMSDRNKQNVIRIVTNITQIKMLKVKSPTFNPEEPVEFLKQLPLLKHLEVLVFHGGLFDDSTFGKMDGPMENVRKLRFENCEIGSEYLEGLQEKFPNIKKPEFIGCSPIVECRDYSDWNYRSD